VSVALPTGIYWPAHRIATSGRYHDSLHTILTEWGLPDIRLANELLDAFEDAR
jgi:hypothetical protein